MGSWLGGGSSGVVELVEGVSGGASGRGGCRATCGASLTSSEDSLDREKDRTPGWGAMPCLSTTNNRATISAYAQTD